MSNKHSGIANTLMMESGQVFFTPDFYLVWLMDHAG
jgi:hypothetical protein